MWAVVKHTPLPYLPRPPRTEVICYEKGTTWKRRQLRMRKKERVPEERRRWPLRCDTGLGAC